MIGPIVIIPGTANNMTSTTVLTSKVLDLRYQWSAAIQAVWTGTPNGAFSIQASDNYSVDPSGVVKNAGTWNDIGVSLTSPAGTASSTIADISITSVAFLRVIYTNVSGTGTLTVTANAKG